MLRVIGHSASAAIAAFGLVFAAPLAAEARDDHRGHHGHKSHGRYHGRGHHHDGGGDHARHHHGGHRGPRHDYAPHAYAPERSRYDYGHSYAPRYRRSVVVHSPFYCGPCGQGFSHRRDFYGHLTGHHGIAVHALSSVIVKTVRGLFYYGY